MSDKHSRGNKGTIHKYLTRHSSKTRELSDTTFESTDTCGEKSVQEKMATDEAVSNAELKSLIMGLESRLDQKLKEGFETITARVDKCTEKIESLEVEVDVIRKDRADDHNKIEKMADEVDELKRSLLRTQTYARKYHLLLYGVEGFERTTTDCIERVRKFAFDNLRLDEHFAKTMVIRNAHRLQKREGSPTPIIVVFLLWSERDLFLRAGKNLAKTGMSVRTDLPPVLKQLRGQLAHRAFELRRDDHIQARLQERGIDIFIETRNSSSEPWRKWTE